jgi:hypothetical protein
MEEELLHNKAVMPMRRRLHRRRNAQAIHRIESAATSESCGKLYVKLVTQRHENFCSSNSFFLSFFAETFQVTFGVSTSKISVQHLKSRWGQR